MIRVHKIAHASYETPDLEQQAEYYTDILGLTLVAKEKDTAYLARQSIIIPSCCAAAARRIALRSAFQIPPDADLDAFEKQVAAQRRQDRAQEGPRAVDRRHGYLRRSEGHDHGGVQAGAFAHQKFTRKGIVPHKLGHVAFHVTDVKHVTKFYCDVLGFRESDWMADFFSFLRCGPDHHTINLMETGSNRHFHTAFELRDWAHMQTPAISSASTATSCCGGRAGTASATISSPIIARRTA